MGFHARGGKRERAVCGGGGEKEAGNRRETEREQRESDDESNRLGWREMDLSCVACSSREARTAALPSHSSKAKAKQGQPASQSPSPFDPIAAPPASRPAIGPRLARRPQGLEKEMRGSAQRSCADGQGDRGGGTIPRK